MTALWSSKSVVAWTKRLANITVAEVLRITHLDRLFDIHSTVEDAIAATSPATKA